MIKIALEEDNETKSKDRILFASQHTWENNAKNIYEVIEKWDQLRAGVPTHYNDLKKIKAKMNKTWDKKLF